MLFVDMLKITVILGLERLSSVTKIWSLNWSPIDFHGDQMLLVRATWYRGNIGFSY